MSNRKTMVEVVESESVPKVSEGSVKSEANAAGFDSADLNLEERIIDVVGQHTEDPTIKHDDLKAKKKKGKSTKDSTETKVVETPKPTCAMCRFWDASTLRDFHRDGIKPGLTEQRAICRAPKDVTKAGGHLVMDTSTRPCNQPGKYKKPAKVVKEKKKPVEEPKTQPAQTETPAPAEKKNKTLKKHNGTERAVATNSLSGDTKVLTHKNGTNKVVVKNVGEE